MNYEEYLRRRISAPSNGLITRVDIYGSVNGGGLFKEVEYRVYDAVSTTTVAFGQESLLGYSEVSRATAYSNLVRCRRGYSNNRWDRVGVCSRFSD